MKKIRILTLACLILSLALLGVSVFRIRMTEDHTLPSLRCPTAPLVLSMSEVVPERLLQDVSAFDEKDGDLTNQIMIQQVEKSVGGSTASVTYVVVDSDNHVASCTRELQYSDYTAPRFRLERELRYSVGAAIWVKDRLTAWDVMDGDISDKIRMISGSINSSQPGLYPVNFEVSNDMGDTVTLSLDILVKNYEPGEPVIGLKDYLLYMEPSDPFSPLDYVEKVSNAEPADVTVQLPEGGLQPGMNRVEYRCIGASGVVGSAALYVVME